MSGSWSDNPNAPEIPYWVYSAEKFCLTGSFIGAMLYGIVILLFFRCMGALLDPISRMKGGINWGLVAHTTTMFLLATIYTAMTLSGQSTSFIDNREFFVTSADSTIPPGPLGFQWFIRHNPNNIVPTSLLIVNFLLAQGRLLYRCYVIYAKKYLTIMFPCMMYFASFATGILFIYQVSRPSSSAVGYLETDFGFPFFALSLSLGILLTLMIVARFVLHRRTIRKAMGAASGACGLYKEISAMIIESFALFFISFLLYIVPWAAKKTLQFPFLHLLAQIQVIAPFLITIRVANRRALTSNNVVSGGLSSLRSYGLGKPANDDSSLSSGCPINSVDASELVVRIETTVDFHHDEIPESEES